MLMFGGGFGREALIDLCESALKECGGGRDGSSRAHQRARRRAAAATSIAALPIRRRSETRRKQDLLAIRLGARRLAIRLSEIAGLFADKKITPVPARSDAHARHRRIPRLHRAGL